MARSWTALRVLLVVFAICLVVATLLSLALGFDLLVQPPALDDSLDLPARLLALQPFREAQWPYDMAASLLFVVGFGALTLAAGPIADLGGTDPRASVLRSAIIASGLTGVISGLLYIGATQVTIALQYCDCGYKTEESISQFWAINIVQGASNWVSYGAIVFGAIAVALSVAVLGGRVRWRAWTWVGWSAVVFLLLSIVLHEVSDSPAGDLVVSVATAILLPVWALILARDPGDPAATPGDTAGPPTSSAPTTA